MKMTILDKLYYVFICSIKRGLGNAERASFGLASAIAAYIISIYCIMIVIFNYSEFNPVFFAALCGITIVSSIYLMSYYFVKKSRYIKILKYYGSPSLISKRKRILYIIFSLCFFFGGYVTFAICGIILSRFLHP